MKYSRQVKIVKHWIRVCSAIWTNLQSQNVGWRSRWGSNSNNNNVLKLIVNILRKISWKDVQYSELVLSSGCFICHTNKGKPYTSLLSKVTNSLRGEGSREVMGVFSISSIHRLNGTPCPDVWNLRKVKSGVTRQLWYNDLTSTRYSIYSIVWSTKSKN